MCSTRGSIDWLCVPRFDDDPVFGRLVGGESAGRFSMAVDGELVDRRYRPRSALLEHRWRTQAGEAVLTEGMVLHTSGRLLPHRLLVRRLAARGGPATVTLAVDPRDGLQGEPLRATARGDAVLWRRGSTALTLRASPPVELEPPRPQRIVVEPQRPLTLAFGVTDRGPAILVPPEPAAELLEASERWWQRWAGRVQYEGPHAESVIRSLITLRLLTYAPSGAPVAAPTTSLPEQLGGGRNWDYRYAWPRDASLGVAAFLSMGLPDEAHSFLHWLLVASRLSRPRLKVLYSLDGKPLAHERELDEVPGYRESRPVRIGNGAAGQHQLDVYGWVVDAAWAMVNDGREIHHATWRAMASFADFVAGHWQDEDAGIWEIRDRPAHYVHSKLLAWVALDRAVRISRRMRTRAARVERWERARDEVAARIRERGLDQKRKVYTRSFGSRDVDAAMLVLPMLGFDPVDAPAVRETVRAIRRELHAGGPFLYRYRPESDGMPGREGAFLPCSFWLVAALARTGDREEAGSLFDELCGHANDLGLFAEEIDPHTGEQLGNFPQALTHAALVQAALALADPTEG